MYQLFIANKNYSSWSLRPWVLMRQLEIPFEEKLVPFGGPADFFGFSPSGKVPCLIDGKTVVWDSLAITEFLAERHPQIWPADTAARAWARCAAAEMHSGFFDLRGTCTMNCGVRVKLKAIPAGLKNDLARLDALWNEGLSRFGGPFLAGPAFTAVDAFFAPVAFRIQTYGLELSAPALHYAEHLRTQPPMQDWYAAALAELWRDAEHEAELAQVGSVLQDLRAPCK
ncbi:MAG: glutathione S-transferase family protein [Pseudomonadota bacterium]